jgi:hypothetical protein
VKIIERRLSPVDRMFGGPPVAYTPGSPRKSPPPSSTALANAEQPKLTHEEMKADLEKADYGDLIKALMEMSPNMSEERAIEYLRSFY